MRTGHGQVLRLPSRHSILGVVTDVSPTDVAACADRVQRVYRCVPGFPTATASYLALPELRAGLVVVTTSGIDLPADGVITWGLPVGATGVATATETERVLSDPRRVSDLTGVFVLVRYDGQSLRMVTSTDFVSTLRRAGQAFATRAVAALTLAGRRPSVDPDAACEYLALYSVLDTGELLTGVTACDEGTVVDLTPAGLSQRITTPLRERLPPGPPPTPADLREVLGDWLERTSRVPDVAVALTAGRDSGLVASCLAGRDLVLPTVTHTVPGYLDNRGAKAVARLYGWSHEEIPATYPDGRSLARWTHPVVRVPGGDVVGYLTRQAAWGEGMQHPRDALIGHLPRPAGPLTTITGHGGETGRAYFWKRLSADNLIEGFVERGPGWHLPARAKQRLRATVETEAALAQEIGRPDAALDLMYPRRQRSWLGHSGLADAPFSDILPAFLTTDVTRTLLDIPMADRRTGALFDAALGLDAADPRAVAIAASQAPGWAARLGKLNPYKVPNDLHLLLSVTTAFEPGGWLVREILGEKWWQWVLDTAPSLPGVRGVLWSSIGIEALHRWLGELPI